MRTDGVAGKWIDTAVPQLVLTNRPHTQRDQDHIKIIENIFSSDARAHEFANIQSHPRNEDRVECLRQLLHGLASTPGISFNQLFWLFTYQPDDVLRYFVNKKVDIDSWATTSELYEALWKLAGDETIPQLSERGRRTAAAYLARTRWILYSLAYQSQVLLSDERNVIQETRLGQLAREAREDWVTVLDTIEDHPLLARDIDAAADAAALTRVQLDQTETGSGPPTPRDAEVWRHCVRHHLLSRFLLGPAWRVAWTLSGTWARVVLWIAGLALFLGVLLLMTSVIWRSQPPLFTGGAVVGGVGYLAIAVAAAGERSASWPWLLRQPASAVVGLLALTTMNRHWWQAGSADAGAARIAAAGLVVASVVYLLVEASNHGVSGATPLLRRVAAVAGLGCVHAILVAGMALRAVVPVYTEEGDGLQCLWMDSACPQGGQPILILILAASWAFATGVFIQILWDDQPSTAPLAHLSWRGRK